MEGLSDKQKRFCEEYVKDNNGTQAAIRAGYSPKTANVQSSQFLTNLNIKTYIDSLQAKMAQESQIDANWVLEQFKTIARITMTPNDKGKIDSHGAARALENIAKHLGFYEKDNSQLNKPTNIKIEIVEPKDE